MKKNLLTLLFVSFNIAVFGQKKPLTDAEVRSFVINSTEAQVGYKAAVDGYYNSISDQLIFWGNPVWKNKPMSFKKPKNDDGSRFFEDSIQVEIYDVFLMGDYANVMGTVKWYISGANTTHRNFSCIVTKEKGQMKYIRYVGADYSEAATHFLWPSTKNKSHETAYFDMREAMMNLENTKALKMSDSLVALDNTLAVAHLGQLQYYQMSNNQTKLDECYNLAVSKIENATPAERHVILSFNTHDAAVTKYHLEQALIYASDDLYLRSILAYAEEDAKKAIQILTPAWERAPENGCVNNVLGYKYMADGQMDKAKMHFEIYLRVYASTPNAYDSMGDFYSKAGDKQKAKAMYLKAYELDNSWTSSKKKADKL